MHCIGTVINNDITTVKVPEIYTPTHFYCLNTKVMGIYFWLYNHIDIFVAYSTAAVLLFTLCFYVFNRLLANTEGCVI